MTEQKKRGGLLTRIPRQNNHGFTMIEVVITIAVIAIIGAILVPIVSQNIDSARFARAKSDVNTLGKAIHQFYKDTTYWPVYSGSTPVQVLYSDNGGTGLYPTGLDWNPAATRLSLSHHLIECHIDISPFNISRTQTISNISWNGPYLSDTTTDPWGKAYVVNAQWLWDSAGSANGVFVICSGKGRTAALNTSFTGGIQADSDDIVFRIR